MYLQSSVSPWARPPAALGQAGGVKPQFGVKYTDYPSGSEQGHDMVTIQSKTQLTALLDKLPDNYSVSVEPASIGGALYTVGCDTSDGQSDNQLFYLVDPENDTVRQLTPWVNNILTCQTDAFQMLKRTQG